MSLRAEKVLVSVATQAIISIVFLWIERMTESGGRPVPPWLITALDRAVPVSPYAVWPYVSWYAIPIVLLMLGRDDFRRASAAVLAAFFVCAVGYVLLPVTMERPAVDAADGLSARLLSLVYTIDRPRNIFPSFHATLCGALLRVTPGSRRTRLLLGGWMAVICCSCVLTKQHYVLDVVAGLAVGAAAVSAIDVTRARVARRASLAPYPSRAA